MKRKINPSLTYVLPGLESITVEERVLERICVVLRPALAHVREAARVEPLPRVHLRDVWVLRKATDRAHKQGGGMVSGRLAAA